MKISRKYFLAVISTAGISLSILLFQNFVGLSTFLPELPSILRKVSIIETELDQSNKGNPYRATLRAVLTSNDGRISMGNGGPGVFKLLNPEALNYPLLQSNNGDGVTPEGDGGGFKESPMYRFNGPLYDENGSLGVKDSHSFAALCDGTTETSVRKNPYSCLNNSANDCYDLVILTSHFFKDPQTQQITFQMWGAPVTVEVENPKTINAAIKRVFSNLKASTIYPGGTTVLKNNRNYYLIPGNQFKGVSQFFEPNTTADGFLLTARVGRTIQDPGPKGFRCNAGSGCGLNDTSNSTNDLIDIIYSYNNSVTSQYGACDPRGWSALNPISRAHDNSEAYNKVSDKYGFARYQMKDSEGTVIPAGADTKGTYPWMDREGKNLFFKVVNSTLVTKDKIGQNDSYNTPFEIRCPVTNANCDLTATNEVIAPNRGTVVMGLWTHGKTVMLDGLVNNVDYGLGVDPKMHRQAKLYDAAADSGWINLGSGRQNTDDLVTPGNTSLISSIENLFSYRNSLTPTTTRDVVWHVSSQFATDEIVFDDWIDPNALIISDMVPSWAVQYDELSKTSSSIYYNGFNKSKLNGITLGYDGGADVRMQNSATSPNLKLPSYGVLSGSNRAEPIAMGGIFGRGLWLNGTSELKYTVPQQVFPEDSWFISMFMDLRITSNGIYNLFKFPDGSGVSLQFNNIYKSYNLKIYSSNSNIQTIKLPKLFNSGEFHNIGLLTKNNGTDIEILVDGFSFYRFHSDIGIFKFSQGGDFVVGDRTAGIRGWIDELHVLNEDVTPEMACNHARGSLAGLMPPYNDEQQKVLNQYPDFGHYKISEFLVQNKKPQNVQRFMCVHNYSKDYPSVMVDLASNMYSVRNEMNFPEGPLTDGLPRPDSTKNKFCLSCHVNQADTPASLSIAALALDSHQTVAQDRRRQPMQPPKTVYGNIPANFYKPGYPSQPTRAPANGSNSDQWFFARALAPNGLFKASGKAMISTGLSDNSYCNIISSYQLNACGYSSVNMQQATDFTSSLPLMKSTGICTCGKIAEAFSVNGALVEAESNSNSKNGAWKFFYKTNFSAGKLMNSRNPGDSISGSIAGKHIHLILLFGPDGGVAKVTIDGQNPILVDTYSQSSSLKSVVVASNLAAGQHTFKIEVSETKNSLSSQTSISVDAIGGLGDRLFSTF